MKTIKKSLSLLLALLMLLSLGSFMAVANEGDGQTDKIPVESAEAEVVSSANDLPVIGGVYVYSNDKGLYAEPKKECMNTNPEQSGTPVAEGQVTIEANIKNDTSNTGLTVND